MHRSGENDNATDREVLVAAGCYTIDVQVAMALRRHLAWLDRTEGCGEFSNPHDGDCSDWVAFARDTPAQWKTRVKRAAKASTLSVEAFPDSGFAVQTAEMPTCVDCGEGMSWNRWLRGAPVQKAREAMRVSPFRFRLSLSLVHDRLQDASSLDCAFSKVADKRSWDARVRHEYSWARRNGRA